MSFPGEETRDRIFHAMSMSLRIGESVEPARLRV